MRDDAVRLSVVLANLPNVPTAPGMLGSIPFLDDSPEPVIILYPGAIDTLVSGVKVCGPSRSRLAIPASRRSSTDACWAARWHTRSATICCGPVSTQRSG